MKTICRSIPARAARGLAVAMLAFGAAGGALASSSYSSLLTISNNQNWDDPGWGEVTIEADDTHGAGGFKFTVNLCDTGSPCSDGHSSDYDSSKQDTIEQFGFNYSGILTMDEDNEENGNIRGAPDGWELTSTRQLDGFGKFLYALIAKGSKPDTVEPLVFWIVANGDSISDYASIGSSGEGKNAGSLFSVKLAATGSGAFIGGGKEVPLPGTLGLLGAGIAGLGVLRKRRA